MEAGAWVGALILWVAGFCLGMELHSKTLRHEYEARTIIEECQAELPRNQQCVLKAVPQE